MLRAALVGALCSLAAPPARAQEAAAEPSPVPGPGAPSKVFETLASPHHLALRDVQRGGTGASVAVGYLGELEENPPYVLRLGVGLTLGLIQDRLRIGLLFPVDLAHQDYDDNSESPADLPRHYTRGGGSDVRAGVGWAFVQNRNLAVAADIAVWIPSGGQPHGIDHTRLVPSLELQTFDGRLFFRGRVGALLDFDETAEQLGALALGLDYVLLGSWTVGVSADGFGGRSGERVDLARDGEGVIGVAVGVASSVALLSWLRLEAGVRVAVTDDYVDQLGRFQLVLGLRADDDRR